MTRMERKVKRVKSLLCRVLQRKLRRLSLAPSNCRYQFGAVDLEGHFGFGRFGNRMRSGCNQVYNTQAVLMTVLHATMFTVELVRHETAR